MRAAALNSGPICASIVAHGATPCNICQIGLDASTREFTGDLR